MQFSQFKNEKLKIFVQNQKLTIFLIASMFLNGYLAFLLAGKATSERVTFLPPFQPTKEFWVTGNRVSASYLEQIGRYVAETLLNVTPDNAKYVKPSILPLVPSEYWAEVDKTLSAQLDYVTENAITRIFHPGGIKWDEPGVIYVRGLLREMTQGDVVALKKNVVYRIPYKVENGRWWLLGITPEEKK